MLSRLDPKLVNKPFEDPALIIELRSKKRFLIFDLGDLSSLSFATLIKVTTIFITHTHIDHFFGFDKIIRTSLGREKTIDIYGPPGLALNVEGKLSSYNWNIIKNYEKNLIFNVFEIYEGYLIIRKYESINQFKPNQEKVQKIKDNVILSEKNLKISAAILDHGTKCIAFSLEESPLIKISKNKVKRIGLTPKRWTKTFKNLLNSRKIIFKKFSKINLSKLKVLSFNLIYLAKKITRIFVGEKITYLTDISYNCKNKKTIFKLSYKTTQLFIEGVFTDKDKKLAKQKKHLTATQAGEIARLSKSEKYTLFHHSSRYIKKYDFLKKEAENSYKKAK